MYTSNTPKIQPPPQKKNPMGTHTGSAFELMIFKVYIYSLTIVKWRMGEGEYSVGSSYKIYTHILKKIVETKFLSRLRLGLLVYLWTWNKYLCLFVYLWFILWHHMDCFLWTLNQRKHFNNLISCVKLPYQRKGNTSISPKNGIYSGKHYNRLLII